MNTTPAQLRLAADILETGHPFEYSDLSKVGWLKGGGVTAADALLREREIRPVLATPPYPAQLHNPDNLTAEQVGVGYRLALPGEKLDANYDYWLFEGGWKKGHGTGVASELNPGAAMRLPLSVPWPEPIDPYAELKAAHAAGKVIQGRPPARPQGYWVAIPNPSWKYAVEDYRIKPEEPPIKETVLTGKGFTVTITYHEGDKQ